MVLDDLAAGRALERFAKIVEGRRLHRAEVTVRVGI